MKILTLSLFILTSCSSIPPKAKNLPQQIPLQFVQELRLKESLQKDRPPFVTAASGVVEYSGSLYFIADDEWSLFSLKPGEPIHSYPLSSKTLAVDIKQRKIEKPDFESLILIDKKDWPPYGALVAWPSGSTLNRMKAVTVPFEKDNTLGKPLESDILPLSYKMAADAGDLNIEGVFVQDKKVFLLQRGNSKDAKNGMFEMPVKNYINGLRNGDWNTPLKFEKVKMGQLNGVKLTLSDAVMTPYGLLGLASAEDTQSSFADGQIMGTALVRIVGEKTQLLGIFNPIKKLEGFLVEKIDPDGGVTLLLVDDADDATKASALFRVYLSAQQLQTAH